MLASSSEIKRPVSTSSDTNTMSTPYDALHKIGGAQRGSLTDAVEEALREAIVTLALEPGMMIDKIAVCERMGVSRFPVSAALARLEHAGLVEVLPQRGTRVKPIALRDIHQHLFIRSALEVETVRDVALHLSPATLESLASNLEQQRAAVANTQRLAFHALDLGFHEILLDAIALPRVKEIVAVSRNALDRARQILASPERLVHTLAEHERIFEAIRKGEADAAAKAMHDHLDQVVTELHRSAGKRPDLFEQ
ncbi:MULTISPECIES: GntR family transcriptional regulator [unclassified Caballeronia]|uniref:GntR family transcriptional regulator n=1 Tax=unclassified Caballeronia TaxID=2646786 RepID=UPI002863F545|nr:MULTISPECIES: GntR family transcriptional regulator [unclassified Caballeronia]MDR5741329.1 GntR family transcriptional regulator [Caballeronia sp. LZ016]MDR5807226.1 GntR family transcriptional regulator [Caballeronia sp. LZ019]